MAYIGDAHECLLASFGSLKEIRSQIVILYTYIGPTSNIYSLLYSNITIPSLVGTVQLRCPFAMIWSRVQHFEYSQSQLFLPCFWFYFGY